LIITSSSDFIITLELLHHLYTFAHLPTIMAGPPPPSPPSPTASFYDLSDNDEDDYNTIAQAQSGRGVKLLYSKSKVRSPTDHRIGFCS
jgi:hypothetical protein